MKPLTKDRRFNIYPEDDIVDGHATLDVEQADNGEYVEWDDVLSAKKWLKDNLLPNFHDNTDKEVITELIDEAFPDEKVKG